MATTEAVKAEDLIPVHSRVAWGPIFAGAVLALATYLLLMYWQRSKAIAPNCYS